MDFLKKSLPFPTVANTSPLVGRPAYPFAEFELELFPCNSCNSPHTFLFADIRHTPPPPKLAACYVHARVLDVGLLPLVFPNKNTTSEE